MLCRKQLESTQCTPLILQCVVQRTSTVLRHACVVLHMHHSYRFKLREHWTHKEATEAVVVALDGQPAAQRGVKAGREGKQLGDVPKELLPQSGRAPIGPQACARAAPVASLCVQASLDQ